MSGMKKTAPVVLLAVLSFPAASAADTRYITDISRFTVRAAQESNSAAVASLASGQAVELLSSDAASGLAQVRLPDGKTGYIQTRFLIDKPAARERVAELEKKLAELTADPKSGAGLLKRVQEERDGLKHALEEAQRNLSNATTALDHLRQASADPVAVAKERDALRVQAASLQKETEQLKRETQQMSSDENRKWFMIGGAVAIGGVLLGLILPYLRLRQRRGSWWAGDISMP
jgi:SH3 domain protein